MRSQTLALETHSPPASVMSLPSHISECGPEGLSQGTTACAAPHPAPLFHHWHLALGFTRMCPTLRTSRPGKKDKASEPAVICGMGLLALPLALGFTRCGRKHLAQRRPSEDIYTGLQFGSLYLSHLVLTKMTPTEETLIPQFFRQEAKVQSSSRPWPTWQSWTKTKAQLSGPVSLGSGTSAHVGIEITFMTGV